MILEIALSFATSALQITADTPQREMVFTQPAQELAFASNTTDLAFTPNAKSLTFDRLVAVLAYTGPTLVSLSTHTDAVGLSFVEAAPPDITLVDSTPVVTLNDPADECSTGADMQFTATPAGGVYTTTTHGGFTDHGDGTATLDVSTAGPGTYDITYTVSFCGCCSASKTVTVSVLTCQIDISGRIIWEKNYLTTQDGVPLVTCTLSGDSILSDDSDTTGYYVISPSGGSNFVITPRKNRSVADGALNGVTAADASRIIQHVSGAFPITGPYKLIAADINNSHNVSSQDANLINQAIIGNPIAQSLFINRTWVFVPKSYVFPDPQNPWSMGPPYFPQTITLTGIGDNTPNQDFIACKLGDVNSTAVPSFKSMVAPGIISAQNRSVSEGQVFTVSFKGSFTALAAQFQLDYEGLELVKLTEVGATAGAYTAGAIKCAMSLHDSAPVNACLFKAKFRATASGLLSDMITLSADGLPAKLFSGSYTEGPLTLKFSK